MIKNDLMINSSEFLFNWASSIEFRWAPEKEPIQESIEISQQFLCKRLKIYKNQFFMAIIGMINSNEIIYAFFII